MPDGLAFGRDGELYAGDLIAPRLSVIDVEKGRLTATYAVATTDARSTGAMLAIDHVGPLAGILCAIMRQ